MMQLSDPSDFKSKNVPIDPGVYLFRDVEGDLLYIGKAKQLRSRVRSYFTSSKKPLKTQHLLSKIKSVDWIIVNNETEALLLENRLVKENKPKYNIDLKDAKTFAYISLTKEKFPRLLTSRRISKKLESFGPYTDGFTRQDLQRLVVKVFKLRVCKNLPKRACLNFHINLCTAPCIGQINEKQYGIQVGRARSFLKGNYEKTIKELRIQMQFASEQKNFECAIDLRNQISSISLLSQNQIVDKERFFDQDVMAFKRVDEKLLVVQMSVRKGVLLGKKDFSLDFQLNIEQDFLKAFYSTNKIPYEILLNQSCWSDRAEKKALEAFLSLKRLAPVKLFVPRRSEKRNLVELAEKNLDPSLENNNLLLDLQTALNLPLLPRIIECFDISNLGQEHVVSGMVRYKDGKPDKSNYRKFRIKTFIGQDDFAAVNEVVSRRYTRLKQVGAIMPDLIVIDGGLGQIKAAKNALDLLSLDISIIGLAKGKEEIYLPDSSSPLSFNPNKKMMRLLRQIRDAAHVFALSYNRKRRQMKLRSEFKAK
jgi:excinuclease ABC subunit C